MPAPIVTDCPYCGSQKVGCDYVSHYEFPGQRNREIGFYKCNNCHMGLVVRATSNSLDQPFLYNRMTPITSDRQVAVRVFPEKPTSRVPDHIPREIAQEFTEAEFNLRHQQWNSAGMGFRRTLDIATKSLWPECKAKWLKARLDAALENNEITPALHGLAITLKDMGDEATHDESRFTKEQASDIAFFTEQFLIACFSIPGRIEEYKAGKEENS